MKRHRTGKIAFMVFFLLYALSPLTYDLSTKSISFDLSRGRSERSLCNASLYLIEALYGAFSGSNKNENESLPNRVLIKKKSAVQRGRFDLFPESGRIVVFAAADLTADRHFSIGSERSKILQPCLRKNSGCLPLFSGLSPPFLS